MKVAFHANIYDFSTERIAKILRAPLEKLGTAVSGEYGGPMECLWVDIHLGPARADQREALPFRFQKRVSGRSKELGIVLPDSRNVGHYSVEPDFCHLLSLPDSEVVPYILNLLLNSIDALGEKRALKGFDAPAFKRAFIHESKSLCGARVA